MRGAAAALVALALAAGCAKKAAPPPAPNIPPLSAVEVQRGQDACAAYAQHVCACAAKVPALADDCKMAGARSEAVKVSAQIAANPESGSDVVVGAQHSLRVTVQKCIEDTAKLSSRGCP